MRGGGVGGVEVAGLGFKDVDEDADVGEDVRFLRGEVGLCEGVLSASVSASTVSGPVEGERTLHSPRG